LLKLLFNYMLYIIETENEVNRQGVSTILATSVLRGCTVFFENSVCI